MTPTPLFEPQDAAAHAVQPAPRVRRSVALPGIRARLMSGSWVVGLALVGIVAIGLAIRLVGLNRVGFNTDEAVYAGQAAGILNDANLKPYFPVFRAHPLLFQFILALVYAITGISDGVGRAVSVVIGVMTVLAVFALGRSLYGVRVGLLAALFMALMPYHVVITRQVILDGPMTLFATLTLCALAHYARVQSSRWLYAAGLCLGLTFLAKETGIILLAAVYLFFALSPSIKARLIDLIIATALCFALVAVFPLVISLAGAARTGQNYLVWQLLRQPNHNWAFYAITALPMIGPLLVSSTIAGVAMRWRQRNWRETLLIAWIVVPTVFFQIWAVKGFQYLLPITPALCILGAVAFVESAPRLGRKALVALVVVVVSLALPSAYFVAATPNTYGLAGTGGLAGGRETGLWFKHNTPKDAQILAIGPSIANLIQFYGHRKTHMLSISPNPLQRNPAYDHVDNPNLRLRNGEFHYIVWDVYSAGRSQFFSDKIATFVQKFNGRVVHTQVVDGRDVVVVYEVRP
jgi:4-amino-4-deoxy-L-arabinose transferase-like glycosyltransferase